MEKYTNVKISFEMGIWFKRAVGETEFSINNYFREENPTIIDKKGDDNEIENYFLKRIEKIMNEISRWIKLGSNWIIDYIEYAYIKVAKVKKLRGGSYIDLPKKLKNKRAIINIKNNDDECLKWAIRAALFPAPKGKNPLRTTSYPTDDGINWNGINFPAAISEIPKKLEKNNEKLSINVFGWYNDEVITHYISKKKTELRINLMLIEKDGKQHYCFVKRLSALLYDQTKHHDKKHYCVYCLQGFTREDLLKEHENYFKCHEKEPMRLIMPKIGEKIKFNNFMKKYKVPFVIYADFESILEKIKTCEKSCEKSFSMEVEKHDACSFCYIVVRSDGIITSSKTYRGEKAVENFVKSILEEQKNIKSFLKENKKSEMKENDWEKMKKENYCHICEKSLIKKEFNDSVPVHVCYEDEYEYAGPAHRKCYEDEKKKNLFDIKIINTKNQKEEKKECVFCKEPLLRKNFRDAALFHCKITGDFIGAVHRDCKQKQMLEKKIIPVVFHNLKGYDSHLIFKKIHEIDDKIECIPNNTEKFISFSFGDLVFIDSMNFLQQSLEKLVETTPKELLRITSKIVKEQELLFKKGVYPYEYIDSFERFNEKSLPEKEKFYSKLNGKEITEEEYEHAKKVWEKYECKTIGDYHDLYLKTDVTLLADVFEIFRKTCLEKYGLDPAHYYTSPGLSWDALLKKTGVELDLLTESEMYNFIEMGMRGGISMVCKRESKANNKYLKDFNPNEPTKFLMYLDENNLYGYAMSNPLPIRNFKWKRKMPTEKEIMQKKVNDPKGWILDVDLAYPKELHEKHNCFPLAPEKIKVEKEWMSNFQKVLMNDLNLKEETFEKLLLTLFDKKNYITHYRNLQFYLDQGMVIKKVNKVLEFDQECWMEPYITMNTEFRKKAKNDFEKMFYKLMNNSVFGKTMENIKKRINFKLIKSNENEKLRKCISSPLYKGEFLISDFLTGVNMRKPSILLNKPIYAGFSILETSKLLMYEFFYGYLKKNYGERCKLIYTDTDSFIIEVETEDFYKDMQKNKDMFDTSDYPIDHFLHSNRNKKVLGKMKDECNGVVISQFIGLRSKMYSIKTENNEEIKKEKGVKKNVIKQEINHQNYKETLEKRIKMRHGMKLILSKNHDIFTMHKYKITLCPLDTKRFIEEDGINTKAYGYKDPERLSEEEIKQILESEAILKKYFNLE